MPMIRMYRQDIRQQLSWIWQQKRQAAEKALELLPAVDPDLVLLDVKLTGQSGIWALERIMTGEYVAPPPPVIMISGHATFADAVQATRLGAYDFFETMQVLDGYDVIEAASAEEALDRLKDPGLGVGVFVTNVIMPGLDGLASWLTRHYTPK